MTDPQQPRRILALPPDLVNKIAAGEVIERPASVVKELLENAFDAGARRVELQVEGGGARLIRVSDDGVGIHEEDLPLAVASHATSKVTTAEDLFAIGTLGFRGEALASIAAVSRLRLASRRRGSPRGAEVRVEGGAVQPVRAAGLPEGTVVEVADLFWNVPARRAFQKTDRSELRAILGEARRQALCRPEVGLRVLVDGAAALEAPPEDEPRARIAQLLGRELSLSLLALPLTSVGGVALRGYATPLDRSRGDSHQQWFFLNGRAIRDVTLLTAVKSAYADLLPPRRHPSVLLWLEVPPAEVDVNVHPQKAEVRFRRAREVFGAVVRSLREAIRAAGGVAPLPLRRSGQVIPVASALPAEPPADAADDQRLVAPLFAAPLTAGAPRQLPTVGRFLQVHRRYVLEETPEGVRFLDPHALHERILYEEILARLRAEPLESQRFLFPLVLEVDAMERLGLAEREETLRRLGFEVGPFGPAALAIHAAPRLLRAERAAEAVRALLDRDPEELGDEELDGRGQRDDPAQAVLHELAASLACKAAVRFGDALPDALIAELLRRRAEVPNGHCCPHGRPTALALSLDELDHRFQRQGAGAAAPAGRS